MEGLEKYGVLVGARGLVLPPDPDLHSNVPLTLTMTKKPIIAIFCQGAQGGAEKDCSALPLSHISLLDMMIAK